MGFKTKTSSTVILLCNFTGNKIKMKSLNIFTLLVFLFCVSFTQAPQKTETDGINFENISFQNAI